MRLIGRLFSVLLFSITASASTAVTLTYTGAAYDDVRYFIADDLIPSTVQPFRGPYDTSMQLSVRIEKDQVLVPDAFYQITKFDSTTIQAFYLPNMSFAAQSFSGPETDVSVTSIELSDGINTFADSNPTIIRLWTDGQAQVSDWLMSGITGTSFDSDFFTSSSQTGLDLNGNLNEAGDIVGYRYEYESLPDPNFFFFGFGTEEASARASNVGTWSGSAIVDIPVAPLPASLSFLLLGLGAFGFAARRRA